MANLYLIFFFPFLWVQPLIVNALGPVANISPAAPSIERPNILPPAVSISSLVSPAC